MLKDVALYLAAAVLAVPLFKRLGLGAVLGYLFAGLAIGPWGLKLIDDVERILHFSEFGVVLLMFVIGLELQLSRLWRLRAHVFGIGGAQVLLSTAVIAGLALWGGLDGRAALVAGFGLAMSSTAYVLQMLAERKELTDRHGRASFAILLFQDLAVIPFLAALPLLATQGHADASPERLGHALRAIAVLVAVIVGGRYLLRPVFRAIAVIEMPEVFTAAALLTVVGTALAMTAVGLSMSLGAFLAGVLLADSEYRHELQADIEPFKGLLLGLFFISIGMSANLGLVLEAPGHVALLVAGLLATKALLLVAIGRIARMPWPSALRLGFALAQGGEFAFVLFGVAADGGLLDTHTAELLVVVVTSSMIVSAPLYTLVARVGRAAPVPDFDAIEVPENDVLIAGFGPFGQIIGRMLRLKNIPFTVLDRDATQVDFVRQFGNRIFYSDAGRLEVLRAAKADKARFFVLAVAHIEQSLRIAETVRRHFPNLRIFACARDRQHAMRLMDLGIDPRDIIRRSYASSLEMTSDLLRALGEDEARISRDLARFRHFDRETLLRQHAIYRDEKALIQSAKDIARELQELFEADRAVDGRAADKKEAARG